jgi:DNA-binding transcriptional regulator YbjK
MSTKILSLEEVRKNVPAAFAKGKAEHLSDRYVKIETADVISAMLDMHYVVVAANQDRATKRDPRYVRHSITFRHSTALKTPVVGGVVPQVIFVNSHNGRTRASYHSGLFRFVCSNGLVIGQSTVQQTTTHAGQVARDVIENIRNLSLASAPFFDQIEKWEKMELTERRINAFAKQAAVLRFGEERAKAFDPKALLTVNRPQDEGNSLWLVMNRVQENAMKGGIEGKNANARVIHSKAITGITNNIEFNSGLWALTAKTAEAVS